VENKKKRLYFIDAMRAWAILMMLQGHFIDGLLGDAFRDNADWGYGTWKYFRGITAPVFFAVSGFIFTYLLIRVPQKGLENPRIKKGIHRGLQLVFIGYLLRTNLFGILQGKLYDSFFLVDVLHCIGLSILGIIGIYLLTVHRKKFLLPTVLIVTTCLLFAFEPLYKQGSFSMLPEALANYISKANGSVFTIIPWFGYATFGGFLSILFYRNKERKNLYPIAIGISALSGLLLIFGSSPLFHQLYTVTGIQLLADIYFNNYLFIRLGDVLVVFAIFMLIRKFLTNNTLLRTGQNTLSIYVIHFIILYGSFTGLGLYGFFEHSLPPSIAIVGAIAFMVVCSYLALMYDKHEVAIKSKLSVIQKYVCNVVEGSFLFLQRSIKTVLLKMLQLVGLAKN